MRSFLLALVTLFLASSCTVVLFENPLGTEAVECKAEDWKGLWVGIDGDDGVFAIEVLDEKKGLINIGMLNEKNKKFKMGNFPAQIKSYGNLTFINVKAEDWGSAVEEMGKGNVKNEEGYDKAKDNYYSFCLIVKENQILLYELKMSKLNDLFAEEKSNELKFSIEKLGDSSYQVTGDSKAVLEFINKYKNNVIKWRSPRIYTRIFHK